MRLILVAALLIGLPALAAVLFYWGSIMMVPALVSLCLASLPFVGFAVVLRFFPDEWSEHG